MKDEVDVVRNHFKVYDVPIELINKYIAYAKLYCDNQAWKVLEIGMKMIEEGYINVEDLQKQIEMLKIEINDIKDKIKEKKDGISTFGGKI